MNGGRIKMTSNQSKAATNCLDFYKGLSVAEKAYYKNRIQESYFHEVGYTDMEPMISYVSSRHWHFLPNEELQGKIDVIQNHLEVRELREHLGREKCEMISQHIQSNLDIAIKKNKEISFGPKTEKELPPTMFDHRRQEAYPGHDAFMEKVKECDLSTTEGPKKEEIFYTSSPNISR